MTVTLTVFYMELFTYKTKVLREPNEPLRQMTPVSYTSWSHLGTFEGAIERAHIATMAPPGDILTIAL